jgi:hypothetical protein
MDYVMHGSKLKAGDRKSRRPYEGTMIRIEEHDVIVGNGVETI